MAMEKIPILFASKNVLPIHLLEDLDVIYNNPLHLPPVISCHFFVCSLLSGPLAKDVKQGNPISTLPPLVGTCFEAKHIFSPLIPEHIIVHYFLSFCCYIGTRGARL